MKKLICLTLSFMFLFSFAACKKKELPPELTDSTEKEQTQASPYTNEAENNGPYITNEESRIVVYGDRMYYPSNRGAIQYIQLGDLKSDLRTIKKADEIQHPSIYSPCVDPVCSHSGFDCPAYLHDLDALFVIDSKESHGDSPIIYLFRCTAGNINFEDPWASDQTYEIVRYDTGMNVRTQIAMVGSPIKQMMVYNDTIYFITQTSEDTFHFNRVSKSGGEVVTLSLGDCYLNIIGATPKAVYLNDEKGNIIEVDPLVSESNRIFYVDEVYAFYPNRPARFNFFIEGDYLYYYDDFVTKDEPQNILGMIHTIRRIDLNNPMGEGELVVSDVIADLVYGVYNGVLYFAPYDYVPAESNEYVDAYSNGRISAVRLDTLERYDVVTDCGLSIDRAPCYVTDRCIIETVRPYRDGFWMDRNSCGYYTCLFDFQTGALYIVGASGI